MNDEPQRFTYIDAIWQSFFSSRLYVDVARRWRGIGFLYLLLIVFLCWIPDLAKMQVGLQHFRSNTAEGLIRQVPPITIKDGEVSVDAEMPYLIKNPETGKVVAIIDTTGQYTSLDNTSAAVLLTQKDLITKQNNAETRVYSLSGIKSFYLDQTRIHRWAYFFLSWLVLIIAPFVILFTFAFRIIQALLYAAIGLAFADSFHVKLTYSAVLRITCVVLTPVIALTTLAGLLPLRIQIPWTVNWLIHLVIAMAYLAFALKACAAEPPVNESTTPAPISTA